MKLSMSLHILAMFALYGMAGSAYGINHINLSQAQASFVGIEESEYTGQFMSLGDVNGDGYADLLIGADGVGAGSDHAGQVYILWGKPDGWQMRTPLSEADASFLGELEGDNAKTVSIPGDVNGDGIDDILIGAPIRSGREQWVGETYLIFGRHDNWNTGMDLSSADASFIGVIKWGYSGETTSGGDVNGDGFDDIVIGTPGSTPEGNSPGWVYVFFGKAGGWRMRTKVSQADVSFVGENIQDGTGSPVQVAGDVNGDGYKDILIGAFQNDCNGERSGQVYMMFGKPSGWGKQVSLSEADASFIGEHEWDNAGFSLAGAGDVNGDGYDDILIGAYSNNDGGESAGQVYLILGKPAGWSMRTSLSQADASFIGEGAWDQAGTSVAGAGDVNGDGYSDLLIGASASPIHGAGLGRAYLIFGRPDNWGLRLSLAAADISFEGEEVRDCAGSSFAGGDDVNGDGLIDIAVGACYNDDLSGQTYLFLHIPVTIVTPKIPETCVKVPFEFVLSAAMGAPPYSWGMVSGILPNGLVLDSTGTISGVPTSADTSEFTVQVTDDASDTNSKSFTIIIRQSGGKGDINGDCQVNIVDVIFTVNIILELYDPTPTQKWAANCDDNGVVDIMDAICLVNIILEGGDFR